VARQAAYDSVISRRFNHGEAIYRRGETAASAFELRAGQVRLSWPDEAGLELSTVLGAGQAFGVPELISGDTRTATAEAVGDAVVSELSREELARLLANDAQLAGTMFRPAFERLYLNADGVRAQPEIAAASQLELIAPPAELFVPSELRLSPDSRELSGQMHADGIVIAALPFHVGRRSSRVLPAGGDAPINLVLSDAQPYSLSRRHFAIETRNGGYVVRDCASHHGTIVNGTRLGGRLKAPTAPLLPGENRIVAGPPTSAFRFVLTIEAA
jgi:hypothetical protein